MENRGQLDGCPSEAGMMLTRSHPLRYGVKWWRVEQKVIYLRIFLGGITWDLITPWLHRA